MRSPVRCLAGLVVVAALAACGAGDARGPTGAVCPTPDPMTLTWDSFGRDFMARYCTMCHASTLPRSQRNGAPVFHDFDTLLGVRQVIDHVDEYAGFGPDAHNTVMPTARCPSTPGGPIDRACAQPTAEERTTLSVWLACERQRPYVDPVDAGLDAGPDAGVDAP
ncbi:MAG: hypothetical protein R3B06_12360 [Kofleriaceae bacterium]